MCTYSMINASFPVFHDLMGTVDQSTVNSPDSRSSPRIVDPSSVRAPRLAGVRRANSHVAGLSRGYDDRNPRRNYP